jgi:hypothetical protein
MSFHQPSQSPSKGVRRVFSKTLQCDRFFVYIQVTTTPRRILRFGPYSRLAEAEEKYRQECEARDGRRAVRDAMRKLKKEIREP